MAKKTINGLPVFEARMTSENCGVLRVSLVDNPAVESDFVAYGEHKPLQLYKITDEDKRRVFGCVLRADYPIYRRDKDNGEYYIVFKADEIRAFAQKYLKDGLQNEVDLEHDFKSIEGAEMVQYFIKDTEGGIAPAGFDEVADGSLFAEYQITDADLWERIKNGEFHGFSVEIIHAVLPAEYTQIKTNMRKSVLAKVKDLLSQVVAEVEAEEQETPANENYKAVSTDKGVIRFEGDDLAEGVLVHGEDEDGNQTALEDGDYKTGDNRVIVVKDGKVAEIKDAEVESNQSAQEGAPAEGNAPAEGEDAEGNAPAKDEAKEEFSAKVAKYSASYNEKTKKISAKIFAKLGFGDYWIYECGDDFAVIEYYKEGGYAYRKYAVSWEGDEPTIVDDGVDGHIGFIADNASEDYAAEKAQLEQEHKDALAAKDAEIADLKAKLEAPAGQSAHDAYRAKKGTYAGANPIADAMQFLK